MEVKVVDVDLVEGGIIVNFADGSGAFFDAKFLHDHRSDNGNKHLPDDRIDN